MRSVCKTTLSILTVVLVLLCIMPLLGNTKVQAKVEPETFTFVFPNGNQYHYTWDMYDLKDLVIKRVYTKENGETGEKPADLKQDARKYGKYQEYNVYMRKSGKRVLDPIIIRDGEDLFCMSSHLLNVNEAQFLDGEYRYWAYFDENGVMARDKTIDGVFYYDENGVMDFSVCGKDLMDKIQELRDAEPLDQSYSSPPMVRDMVAIQAIISRQSGSTLGRWASAETTKKPESYDSFEGHFETDSKGRIRYWADYVSRNLLLYNRSSIENYHKLVAGLVFVPDPVYDWHKQVIAENEYLANRVIEIDGYKYQFDKDGYALRNSWGNEEYGTEDCYFGNDGKMATNAWVPMGDNMKYVGDKGYFVKETWLTVGKKHFYVDYNGNLVFNATEDEYKVYQKINEFMNKYPDGTHMGICSTFEKKIRDYVFGPGAKATTYKYDPAKVKIGDTFSYTYPAASHILMFMDRTTDGVFGVAESNWDWDESAHYGRMMGDLDNSEYYTHTTLKTYYDPKPRPASDFKPEKAGLKAKKVSGKAEITIKPVSFASGYTVYLSKNGGAFKKIKDVSAESALSFTRIMADKGSFKFKVRAYVNVDGKKVYGAYSETAELINK